MSEIHFYLFLASVVVLNQRWPSHVEAVVRRNDASHDVSDDAISDVRGDGNQSLVASSEVGQSSPDYCAEVVKAYGGAASAYIRCVLLRARDFRKCRSCQEHYAAVEELYVNITETRERNSGSSCFAGSSPEVELMALSDVNNFIQNSWKMSFCSYCFSNPSVNGSYSLQLNNVTVVFFQLFSIFRECVLNDTQGNSNPFNGSMANVTGNQSICSSCQLPYSQLNDFYRQLEDEDALICADMENTMNLSRSLWNDACHKVILDVKSMATVGVLASLPVVFYVTTAFGGKRPHPTMLKQKRWDNVPLVKDPGSRMIIDQDSYDLEE